MPLPSALMLPGCLLIAQAPAAPVTAPHALVRAICLSLKGAQAGAAGLDLRRIETDLAGLLTGAGIAVIPASEASTRPGAYRLDLAVEASDFPEGSRLLSVQAALERLTGLETLAKGEEFRWVGYAMSAHAAGEAFPSEARRTALLVAASLIGKAEAAHGLATSAAAPPPAVPFPVPPSALPKAEEVTYSEARVRHRPPTLPYPPAAEAAGVQGTVTVIVTVDPEGRPVRAMVESGPQELKAAALRHALQWRFAPAAPGTPSPWVWFKLPVPFQLAPPLPPADAAGDRRSR